ncbi:MAG: helix-turn-helix transcriptional regulator [Oscillospiraceae bacterium]|nr:helix-turn-helix transcriptional regulator [Oscillospiraceae bacterium]
MKIYWHKGKKNIIGGNIRQLRRKMKLTQEQLAARLQVAGYELDRLAIVRIEADNRFIADYEVKALAGALNVSIEKLYEECD